MSDGFKSKLVNDVYPTQAEAQRISDTVALFLRDAVVYIAEDNAHITNLERYVAEYAARWAANHGWDTDE